jgi:hypothetical protein
MVGIAGAGIVGAALLVGTIMFFVVCLTHFFPVSPLTFVYQRRFNKKHDAFDADEFRQQSVVLDDDNYADGNARGPRPPTMFERHNQTLAILPRSDFGYQQNSTYGQSYGAQNPFSDYNAPQGAAFSPGMYLPSNYSSPVPGSATPFMATETHSAVPSEAASGLHDVAGSPTNGASSALSRNNSFSYNPESDYVDLSRASVTPFQAAQYEAISKQLNIPVPQPLPRVDEGQEADIGNSSALQHDSSIHPPFDGPTPNPFEDEDCKPARPSSDFNHETPEDLATPDSLMPRVVSKPPSLPEIHSQHMFSPIQASFPTTASPRKESFDISEPEDHRPSTHMPQLSPTASSPQRAQVTVGEHDGRETPVQLGFVGNKPSETNVQPKVDTPSSIENKTKAPIRPETMYDDEDAYGGM